MNEFNKIVGILKERTGETSSKQSIQPRASTKRKTLSISGMSALMKPKRSTTIKTNWTDKEIANFEEIHQKEAMGKIKKVDLEHLKQFPLQQEHFQDNNPLIKTNKMFDNFYDDKFPTLQEELNSIASIKESTTIDQRIAYPVINPTAIKQLYPKPVNFISKKIRQCRTCLKPVVTPKMGATPNFDWLILFADHAPRLTLKKMINFVYDIDFDASINFSNNTKDSINISLKPINENLFRRYLLTNMKILSSPDFKIKSALDVYIAMTKESKEPSDKKTETDFTVEEVKFQIPVKKENTNPFIKFGFELHINPGEAGNKLQVPIVVNLGKPNANIDNSSM
jgi:hypothetical protein